MDAMHTPALLTAVDDMTKRLNESEALGGFRCVEVDAIATVLAIAGHESTAARLIAWHADADDDLDDRHAHIWDLIQRTNHGTPPVVEAATTYVRELVNAHLTDQWARPTPPRSEPPAGNGDRLVEVSGAAAQFSGDELDCLVITAGEAVYGDLDDLSGRQITLAKRAYDAHMATMGDEPDDDEPRTDA